MPVCKFRKTMVTAAAPRGHRVLGPASAKLSIFGFWFFAVALVGAARAADMPAPPPPVLPLWTWTGGYVGTHIGAAWGDTKFSDPAGTSLFGDQVSTPGVIGGFQAGYNWQVPQSRFVLGIEGDLSGIASKGSNTCLASSRLVVSADCRSRSQCERDRHAAHRLCDRSARPHARLHQGRLCRRSRQHRDFDQRHVAKNRDHGPLLDHGLDGWRGRRACIDAGLVAEARIRLSRSWTGQCRDAAGSGPNHSRRFHQLSGDAGRHDRAFRRTSRK